MSDELTGKFGLLAEISPDKYRYTVFGNSGGLFEGVKCIVSFFPSAIVLCVKCGALVIAGEKSGFLPGNLQTKVDPYLRPLYDALQEMLGMDNYLKLIERGAIEIAPLAYMRGRTLSNAFIILEFGGILHYVQKDVKKYVILSVSEISHCIKCSVLIRWDSSFHSE